VSSNTNTVDITAAATSAALILSQMHTPDTTVLKHCWVAIFTSYISAALLLYAIVRARIANTPVESPAYSHAAEQCLQTLRFCASTDSVAATLLANIEGHYHYLRRDDDEVTSTAIITTNTGQSTATMPPPSSSSLEDTAAALLQLLCHPLRNTQSVFTTNITNTTDQLNNNPQNTTQNTEQEEENNTLIRTIQEQNLKSTCPDDTAIVRLVERLDVGYEERVARATDNIAAPSASRLGSRGEADELMMGMAGGGGMMGRRWRVREYAPRWKNVRRC